MRVVVAVVGKPRHQALREAILDYESRAARYWPLEVHEVREENAGALGAGQVKAKEAKRIRDKIPEGARVIACDAGGASRSSAEFAAMLQQQRESGRSVAFVIGGAFGLDSDALNAAEKMSLAPFTLPHELARLVLAEQLYRAGTIVKREPYHK